MTYLTGWGGRVGADLGHHNGVDLDQRLLAVASAPALRADLVRPRMITLGGFQCRSQLLGLVRLQRDGPADDDLSTVAGVETGDDDLGVAYRAKDSPDDDLAGLAVLPFSEGWIACRGLSRRARHSVGVRHLFPR